MWLTSGCGTALPVAGELWEAVTLGVQQSPSCSQSLGRGRPAGREFAGASWHLHGLCEEAVGSVRRQASTLFPCSPSPAAPSSSYGFIRVRFGALTSVTYLRGLTVFIPGSLLFLMSFSQDGNLSGNVSCLCLLSHVRVLSPRYRFLGDMFQVLSQRLQWGCTLRAPAPPALG